MARQKNEMPSVKITITTTEAVANYLKALLRLGVYGATVAEAAERIVCEKLQGDLRRKRSAALEAIPAQKPIDDKPSVH
jgi:hypothetical protein